MHESLEQLRDIWHFNFGLYSGILTFSAISGFLFTWYHQRDLKKTIRIFIDQFWRWDVCHLLHAFNHFMTNFLRVSLILLIGFNWNEWILKSTAYVPPSPPSMTLNIVYGFAALLSHEFAFYWTHICLHRIPYLWAFHRLHHSTTRLSFFARGSAHVFEFYLNGTVLPFAILASALVFQSFGFYPDLYRGGIVYLFLKVPLDWIHGLAHTEVPFYYSGRINWIFESPHVHQVHHSKLPHHMDKNFGLHLSIFDWLFGTLYIPEPGEKMDFGLLDERGIDEKSTVLDALRFYFISPFEYIRNFQNNPRPRNGVHEADKIKFPVGACISELHRPTEAKNV